MKYLSPREVTNAEEAFDFLGVTEAEVKQYFLKVEEVMHHLIQKANVDEKSAKAYWVSGVNPYYSQLTPIKDGGLGLALVEYYLGPSKLSTPFGSISIGGVGADDVEWFYAVREDFGLKPLWGDGLKRQDSETSNFLSERDDITYVSEEDGCFGPVWEITKFLDKYTFSKAEFMPTYIGIPAMRTHICFDDNVVSEIWSRCQPEGFRLAKIESDAAFSRKLETSEAESAEPSSPSF